MRDSECAVILAGGVGRRLRPFTTVLPKPLMPLGETPILEIVIRQLASRGFGRIILAVQHRDALIRAVLGDGSAMGVEIEYSRETSPLGTIGPLHLVADRLPESFLLMNGDLLTDLDFAEFLGGHRSGREWLTVGVVRREQPVDFGVVEIDGRRAAGFREKPVLDFWVSMGVYALRRSVLDLVPRDRPFGFDDLMRMMLDRGLPIGVHRHDGEWHDIGRPDDLELAAQAFEQRPGHFLAEAGVAAAARD